MNELDDDGVLGALPPVPADVWERVSAAALDAAPGSADLSLLPEIEDAAADDLDGPFSAVTGIDDLDGGLDSGSGSLDALHLSGNGHPDPAAPDDGEPDDGDPLDAG